MPDNMLTQKMKRVIVAVIVVLRAGKKESEITTYVNVSLSFVYKVRNELVASVDEISTVSERKKTFKTFGQYADSATNRSGKKYYW